MIARRSQWEVRRRVTAFNTHPKVTGETWCLGILSQIDFYSMIKELNGGTGCESQKAKSRDCFPKDRGYIKSRSGNHKHLCAL